MGVLLLLVLLPQSISAGERPKQTARHAQNAPLIAPQCPSPACAPSAIEHPEADYPPTGWQAYTTPFTRATPKPKTERQQRKARRQKAAVRGMNNWMKLVLGPFVASAVQRFTKKKKQYWKQIVYSVVVILVGIAFVILSNRFGGTSFGGNSTDWLFRFMGPFGIVIIGVGGILLALAIYYIIREIRKEKEKEREKERARRAAEKRREDAKKRMEEKRKKQEEDDRNKQLTPEELKRKQREYLKEQRRKEFEKQQQNNQPAKTDPQPKKAPADQPPKDQAPERRDPQDPMPDKRQPRRPAPEDTPPPQKGDDD